jgi:hypothetical protein
VPLPESASVAPADDPLSRLLAYLPLIFGGGDDDSSAEDSDLVSTFSSPVGGFGLTEAGCRLIQVTRSLGYSYDRLHRLTAASYPAAGAGQPAQSYAYSYGCLSVSRGKTLKFDETS